MSKGKGTGSLFHLGRRSSTVSGKPVMTRLTRTMGFVELSHSQCARDCSIDAYGDDDLDFEESFAVLH